MPLRGLDVLAHALALVRLRLLLLRRFLVLATMRRSLRLLRLLGGLTVNQAALGLSFLFPGASCDRCQSRQRKNNTGTGRCDFGKYARVHELTNQNNKSQRESVAAFRSLRRTYRLRQTTWLSILCSTAAESDGLNEQASGTDAADRPLC